MPERTDYRALIVGHAGVITMINSGGSGLPVLTRLLRVAEPAVDAAALLFVEFAPAGGRVIAATGRAEFVVGRPLPPTDPATVCLLSGPAVREVRVDAIPGALADEVAGRGLCRMIVARAEIGGRTVGSLHALFPDGEPLDDSQRAAIGYVAGCIAQLYRDQTGLPVRGGGPVVATRTDGDHDRDLFVAVTSHELRTPVTVIKGYADTLTDHWKSLSDDDRRHAARIIGQRANDLARLVDRLLTAATEHRRGEPAAPFDLADALRTAVTDLPADVRHRIVLDLPADLPKALGDRHTLTTVLTELSTNAGKYSLPDTPIEVTAEANERTVSFRVADRGIGIRPEHVERAFDRFWQGESGDRRRYPGAGLGLYLVRQIVEQQNGWVSLRPRDGGGTVAEVRLPRG